MLLHGVLKTFWLTALTPGSGVLSADDRKLMKSRGGGVVVTADFSNNYADVTTHAKTWKIHDWHGWVDCWSYFILKDITLKGSTPKQRHLPPIGISNYTPPRNFTMAVHHLHAAITFFIRP
jgi:hypothetical protein